jgi:hypothetical protein
MESIQKEDAERQRANWKALNGREPERVDNAQIRRVREALTREEIMYNKYANKSRL